MTRSIVFTAFMVFTSLATTVSFWSCHQENPEKKVEEKIKQEPATINIPEFNGKNAYNLVEQQVNFGSRVPNSNAHDKCKEFLVAELTKVSDTVLLQNTTQVVYGTSWKLTNIIAQFNPEKKERVMLCAHWDSRPRSDEDSNPANFKKGIPGANDGGSGVAILLELAKIFGRNKPSIGVDIVLFDGEDIGLSTDSENFCIGSKYFAQNFPLQTKPAYAILLDIVGDLEARFFIEQQSYMSAPFVCDKVWSIGKELNPTMWQTSIGGAVTDDHLQLIEIGIPAIDIIDMELVGNRSDNPRRRYWHTQNDEMSNISEVTLGAVGTVLTKLIYVNPL